jgi:hypothetical protein
MFRPEPALPQSGTAESGPLGSSRVLDLLYRTGLAKDLRTCNPNCLHKSPCPLVVTQAPNFPHISTAFSSISSRLTSGSLGSLGFVLCIASSSGSGSCCGRGQTHLYVGRNCLWESDQKRRRLHRRREDHRNFLDQFDSARTAHRLGC